MKKLFVIILLFSMVSVHATVDDWGKTGHRATAEIASQYLNKKARKAIKKLLDGQSLATVSTFADDIKSDSKYRYLSPTHYVNIPFDKTYDSHPKNEKGDIIQAIDDAINILQSDKASKEEKVFHLKMLVHYIGDLHQPLHTGLKEDKGGNDFQVRWFRDGTNLHSVWDSKIIDSYGMSYSELAVNMVPLSRKQYKKMSSGSHRDWLKDSREQVKDIYANVEEGDKLGYAYMYKYTETMKSQLQKGGVRLAALLNDLLG
ncbi:MAG: S1/P1 nuclease [Nonlabens sp.]